ncbi:hypothetical protein JHD50_10230, partial [Sulfurimonas sp. MAG313]
MRRKGRKQKTNNTSHCQDQNYYVETSAKDQVLFWSLSILLELHGHREFVDKNGYLGDVDLAYFLH